MSADRTWTQWMVSMAMAGRGPQLWVAITCEGQGPRDCPLVVVTASRWPSLTCWVRQVAARRPQGFCPVLEAIPQHLPGRSVHPGLETGECCALPVVPRPRQRPSHRFQLSGVDMLPVLALPALVLLQHSLHLGVPPGLRRLAHQQLQEPYGTKRGVKGCARGVHTPWQRLQTPAPPPAPAPGRPAAGSLRRPPEPLSRVRRRPSGRERPQEPRGHPGAPKEGHRRAPGPMDRRRCPEAAGTGRPARRRADGPAGLPGS